MVVTDRNIVMWHMTVAISLLRVFMHVTRSEVHEDKVAIKHIPLSPAPSSV